MYQPFNTSLEIYKGLVFNEHSVISELFIDFGGKNANSTLARFKLRREINETILETIQCRTLLFLLFHL
uniref:Uncharacterized protein n=1 Tax=Octopus bimaculoides TaxID=37653 RepID=A0A0L8FYJ9_OCTBM